MIGYQASTLIGLAVGFGLITLTQWLMGLS